MLSLLCTARRTYLLVGNDGGVHATLNASTAVIGSTRPTWMNQDGGINAIEFYSGDISGNFATLGESLCGWRRSGQRTQLGDVLGLAHRRGAVADGPGWRWLLRVDRSGGHGFHPGPRNDHIDHGWFAGRSAIPDRSAGLHLRHLWEWHRPSRVELQHHDGRQ